MTSVPSSPREQENYLVWNPERKQHSFIQRMFLRHHSEEFADKAEYTFRATLCVVAMSVPFMLPEGTFPSMEAYVERGFVSRNTILMFIMTSDMTVAETISNAAAGMLGVLLSWGNISLMQWVIPGGFSPDTSSPVQAAVIAHSVLFMWFVLWLNFGMNTRIFCLMNFSYELMDFMNPGSSWCDERSFCTPITAAQAAVACILALLVSLLPTPLYAMRRARNDAKEIADGLSRAWLDLGATFCAAHTADYRQDGLVGDLQTLRTHMRSFESNYMNSYDELGWIVVVRHKREHLGRLSRTLHESCDRLFCLWNTCLKESFPSIHDEVMPKMWPLVYKVLSEAMRLLQSCTVCAGEGRMRNADQSEELRKGAETTRAAIASLTGKFREERMNRSTDGVIEELYDEQHFLLSVCAMGRLSAELAEDLIAHHRDVRPLGAADRPLSIIDKTVLTNRAHLNFAVRGLITMSLAFAVGYFGHSKLLLEYDAGTAAVVALLLRKSAGSANARNLQRLRGVGIGTVGGAVVYSMFGWCSMWSYLLMLGSIACWVGSALYHHQAGPIGAGITFGHISGGASAGLLSAYFGARAMSERCVAEVYTQLDVFGMSYNCFVTSLAAVFLCFVVDWLLAPDTAAQLAASAMGEAWHTLGKAVDRALDARDLQARSHSPETLHSLRVAEALGLQADLEPRYWRRAWPTLLYTEAVDSATRLRMTACGLEYCIADGGRFGAGKAEKVRKLTGLPSFAPVNAILQDSIAEVSFALQSVLSQEVGWSLKALARPELQKNRVGELVTAFRVFAAEANRELPDVGYQLSSSKSLEEDASAICSVILSCIASMVGEAQMLQSALIRPVF